MATPYKNVKGGWKDDYNFYHSQVRITVECAFGMLVQRWGVLRRAISTKVSTKKVTCLCMALCRLHNFCINARLKPEGINVPTPSHRTPEEEDLAPLASDSLAIEMNAGISLDRSGRPTELLHGGEHFDDMPNRNMRAWRRVGEDPLPRDSMCCQVQRMGMKRPIPVSWRKKATPNL